MNRVQVSNYEMFITDDEKMEMLLKLRKSAQESINRWEDRMREASAMLMEAQADFITFDELIKRHPTTDEITA